MIQTRTLANGQTEIYVENSGGVIGYITESYDTYFHHRYKKKVLTAGEEISDFMEVTETEWDAIAAADSAFAEPDAEFVRQVETAAGGKVYNRGTGYFELNGLTDITEGQMRAIYAAYVSTDRKSASFSGLKIRTHLPFGITYETPLSQTFQGVPVESVHIGFVATRSYAAFMNCEKLRRVYIMVSGKNMPTSQDFVRCYNLEELDIRRLAANLDIRDSPKVTLASLESIVRWAQNDSEIIITLHPEAYARLTEELIAQAADKQIVFATV